MSSLDGDGVVGVPSGFLDGAIFLQSSVCLRTPTGQRHEAVEGVGHLWQTHLCQTGKMGHGPLCLIALTCIRMTASRGLFNTN